MIIGTENYGILTYCHKIHVFVLAGKCYKKGPHETMGTFSLNPKPYKKILCPCGVCFVWTGSWFGFFALCSSSPSPKKNANPKTVIFSPNLFTEKHAEWKRSPVTPRLKRTGFYSLISIQSCCKPNGVEIVKPSIVQSEDLTPLCSAFTTVATCNAYHSIILRRGSIIGDFQFYCRYQDTALGFIDFIRTWNV